MTTMTKAEVLRRVRGLASIERAVLTDMANSANSAEQENAALQAVASLAATLAAVESAFEDADRWRAIPRDWMVSICGDFHGHSFDISCTDETVRSMFEYYIDSARGAKP